MKISSGGEEIMNMYLIASAVIAALALVVIAIVLIIAYKNVKDTMANVKTTVTRVEEKVTRVTDQANDLLEKTNGIATDAEMKLQALDHFTKSAKDLEKTTNHLDASIQRFAADVENPPEKQKKMMEQVTIVTETLARVFYGFKKEKQRETTAETAKNEVKSLPKPQKKIEFHN